MGVIWLVKSRGEFRAESFSSPLDQEVCLEREREIFIDNLLVRIHFIIVMIRWTGLTGLL